MMTDTYKNNFFLILMGIQIVLAFIWLTSNFTVVPTFGDSNEYLKLSKSLLLDEYRPVLYPLIIRFVINTSSFLNIEYQIILYLIQLLVIFFAVFFALGKIVPACLQLNNNTFFIQLFFTLYILSIPMVMFLNLSVLTDSLALSGLIFFLTNMYVIAKTDSSTWKNWIWIYLSFCLQALLRGDRLYSCLFMMLIFSAYNVIQKKGKCGFKFLMISLLVSIVSFFTVSFINQKTQTPGVHGRTKTTASFVLLDRIVWPNMTSSYDYFSKDIQKVISRNEAKKFDKHNNNVMYKIAPLLEKRLGHEKAQKTYREMAGTVLKTNYEKVIIDVTRDFFSFLCIPTAVVLNKVGVIRTANGWNIRCMSSKTKKLTNFYHWYYIISYCTFIQTLSVIIFFQLLQKRNRNLLMKQVDIFFFLIMGTTIIAAWFAFGDGAPPNDRYELIGYITWAMLSFGIICANTSRIQKDNNTT